LYKAEVPTPVPDKLKPRISETSKILWKVYALISLAELILLLFGGMSFFDAICHTFTTMPTGGFSTKNASIAHFDSLYVDVVITVFMLLAGINFSLHFQVLKGNTLAFWKDPECRFFLGVVLLLTIIVSANVFGTAYESIGDAIQYAVFQVSSIITTTGYATADYEQWPAMTQLVILFCMFLGASADPDQLSIMAFQGLSTFLNLIVGIVYGTWFIGKFAATPGKMACGLKIITADGGRVSYARAFGRYFAEMLSGILIGIGYLMIAFDRQKRGLHDHICNTRVIYKNK